MNTDSLHKTEQNENCEQEEAVVAEGDANVADDVSTEITKFDQCQQELVECKNALLYAQSDFQNYKRRTEKERLMLRDHAQSAVLRELLSIVDDFDRAMAQEEAGDHKKEAEQETLVFGMSMIQKSLYKLLQQFQVIEISEVDQFDPALHEGISSVQSDEHESGSIVQVVQKGFRYKEQVLRPAKVIVAQ